jgi:hypothetical protein
VSADGLRDRWDYGVCKCHGTGFDFEALATENAKLKTENAELLKALICARTALSSMHSARAAIVVIDAAVRRQDGPS